MLLSQIKSCWLRFQQQMPVDLETFQRFTFYEEVVYRILQDFATDSNGKIENLQSDEELYDLLVIDLFIKYFTNKDIRHYSRLCLKSDCPDNIKEKLLQPVIQLPEEDDGIDIESHVEENALLETRIMKSKNLESNQIENNERQHLENKCEEVVQQISNDENYQSIQENNITTHIVSDFTELQHNEDNSKKDSFNQEIKNIQKTMHSDSANQTGNQYKTALNEKSGILPSKFLVHYIKKELRNVYEQILCLHEIYDVLPDYRRQIDININSPEYIDMLKHQLLYNVEKVNKYFFQCYIFKY